MVCLQIICAINELYLPLTDHSYHIWIVCAVYKAPTYGLFVQYEDRAYISWIIHAIDRCLSCLQIICATYGSPVQFMNHP